MKDWVFRSRFMAQSFRVPSLAKNTVMAAVDAVVLVNRLREPHCFFTVPLIEQDGDAGMLVGRGNDLPAVGVERRLLHDH